jgi:spore germination cell wall hydrolase CwlJ-like protein
LSGGAFALADQDTITLHSGTQARADWRALVSAAFIGSGVGLSLGAAYLAGGMGQAAADHQRAERIAEASAGVLSDNVLRRGMDPDAVALAKAHDPVAPAPTKVVAPLAAPDPDLARIAAARPTRARELDCLTQAVYFEARGESRKGQAAVATVIMNRVKSPLFPKTVCGVVYQGASHRNGCQFSFACDGLAERVREATAWDRAREVAARALSGAVLREVGSATHFHTTGVSPDWGPQMKRVAQVGLHVFYRFNPHAPRPKARELDDDNTAVFTASNAPPPQLRLAAAVVAPAPAADAAKPAVQAAPLAGVKPAAAAPKLAPIVPAVAPAAKPAASSAPSPLARTDTAGPKGEASEPS